MSNTFTIGGQEYSYTISPAPTDDEGRTAVDRHLESIGRTTTRRSRPTTPTPAPEPEPEPVRDVGQIGGYFIGDREVGKTEFAIQVYGADSPQAQAAQRQHKQELQRLAQAGGAGSGYTVMTRADGTTEVYDRAGRLVDIQQYDRALDFVGLPTTRTTRPATTPAPTTEVPTTTQLQERTIEQDARLYSYLSPFAFGTTLKAEEELTPTKEKIEPEIQEAMVDTQIPTTAGAKLLSMLAPGAALTNISQRVLGMFRRDTPDVEVDDKFDYLKDVTFEPVLTPDMKQPEQVVKGVTTVPEIETPLDKLGKDILQTTSARFMLDMARTEEGYDPHRLVFGTPEGIRTPLRDEFDAELKDTGWDKFKRVFGIDTIRGKKFLEDVDTRTTEATQAATLLLEKKQKEAEKSLEKISPVIDDYNVRVQRLEEKGETLQETEQRLTSMQTQLEQESRALERDAQLVDLTDASAVDRYNRRIEEFEKQIQTFDKEYAEATKFWDSYEREYDEAQQLFQTKIQPVQSQLEGIETEQDKLIDLIYSLPGARDEVADKIKRRDWIADKRLEMDETARRISEDLDWRDDFGRKLAAKTLSGVESVGVGALETFRDVGVFLSSPARVAKRDAERDRTTLQRVGDLTMPLGMYARGIYDWQDPDKDRYKTSTLVDTSAIKGAASSALIGFGALKGAAAGVKPTAVKTATRAGRVLRTAGVGTLVGAGVTAPTLIERAQVRREISELEGEITQLDDRLARGELTQSQYDRTKEFLEGRLDSARGREITGPVAVSRVLGTVGQVATTMAGALTAAKLATPKSVIAPGSDIKVQFQYGIDAKAMGAKFGVGPTAKGVKVPDVPLPKAAPGMKTMQLDVTEKLGGIKNIGKTIQTQYKFYPGKDGVGESVIRTRDFGFQKEITTQIAGQPKATTVVLSPEGTLLRTIKTSPMKIDRALTATTKIIKEGKLYDPIRRQVSDTEVFQKVGRVGDMKVRMDIPGARLTGKGFTTGEAIKFSKATPTIVKTKPTAEIKFFPQEGREGVTVATPIKARGQTEVFTPKLRIGDGPRTEQMYGLTSEQKMRLGDIGYIQKGDRLVPFEQRFMDTVLIRKQPPREFISTDVKGQFVLKYEPKTFVDDTLKPLMYRTRNVGLDTLERLKTAKLPTWGKRAEFGTFQKMLTAEEEKISRPFEPKTLLAKKQKEIIDLDKFLVDQKTKPTVQAEQVTKTLTKTTKPEQITQTVTKLKSPQLPKQIDVPISTVMAKPEVVGKLISPVLTTSALTTGLATVLDQRQDVSTLQDVRLASLTQPAFTTKLDVGVMTVPKLDISQIQRTDTTPALTPAQLVPALTVPTLSTNIPGIPKLPPIITGGRGLSGSWSRPRQRTRARSWVVVNKIADFAGDWARRQQGKPSKIFGGLPTDNNKIGWL